MPGWAWRSARADCPVDDRRPVRPNRPAAGPDPADPTARPAGERLAGGHPSGEPEVPDRAHPGAGGCRPEAAPAVPEEPGPGGLGLAVPDLGALCPQVWADPAVLERRPASDRSSVPAVVAAAGPDRTGVQVPTADAGAHRPEPAAAVPAGDGPGEPGLEGPDSAGPGPAAAGVHRRALRAHCSAAADSCRWPSASAVAAACSSRSRSSARRPSWLEPSWRGPCGWPASWRVPASGATDWSPTVPGSGPAPGPNRTTVRARPESKNGARGQGSRRGRGSPSRPERTRQQPVSPQTRCLPAARQCGQERRPDRQQKADRLGSRANRQ